jgi:hypothetical protein
MSEEINFTYRLAYFLPNPAVLWRLPFAVFVKFGGGCFVGIARLLPDARYLGSSGRAALLEHAIQEITTEPLAYQGHDLSGKLGPHFEIGGTQRIATHSTDFVQWAVDHLLPN